MVLVVVNVNRIQSFLLLPANPNPNPNPRLTLIDVFTKYKSSVTSLGEFFSMVPPLKPRYYSISSSPLIDASVVSLTVGVVKGKAPSGWWEEVVVVVVGGGGGGEGG